MVQSRRGSENDMTTDEVTTDAVRIPDPLDRITAHQSKFLSFLSARVEDRAAAEDILQSAYLKAVEHGSEIRDDESTVAWFYRILRNAITDHCRRRTNVYFCCHGCVTKFQADTTKYLQPKQAAPLIQLITKAEVKSDYTCPMHPEVHSAVPGSCSQVRYGTGASDH
jgi:hypothetical protein